MDKSKISVNVVIDHEQNIIKVKRIGDKTPISLVHMVTNPLLASAYRDAAAYFLDLAAQVEGECKTLEDQTKIMYHEHKNIFKGR